MVEPVKIRASHSYRIHVEYADGVGGEVDLSEFAGKGVFSAWDDPAFFAQVHIGEHRQIRWNDQIELCPDMIYMKLTNRSPEEYFALWHDESAHA